MTRQKVRRFSYIYVHFFVHCKGSGSYLNELNCAVDSAVSSPASYSPALHTLSHVSDDPKRLREQSV